MNIIIKMDFKIKNIKVYKKQLKNKKKIKILMFHKRAIGIYHSINFRFNHLKIPIQN